MTQTLPETVDYVIVGGGTAGNVVALRLAERGNSVLVLESGKDDSEHPEVKTPGLFAPNFMNPERNWNFMSTPQAHADGRQIPLPRGKTLGGCSNINLMQLTRPASHEFNDAFRILGIEGWNWDDLLPYYKKTERLNLSSPVETYIRPEPSVHGDSGLIEVTAPTMTLPSRELAFKALNEAGVKTNPDPTCGTSNLGVWNSFQAIDSNGTRVSSATAYLTPNLSKLPNLHLATSAHVARVLFAASSGGGPLLAEGVEYIHDGKKSTVKANKEVVLCAGSYLTPQVLELSGIGDRNVLSKHGITTLVDSPGVGTNLQEHIFAPMSFELVAGTDSFDSLRSNPASAMEELKKYQETGKGKFSLIPLSFITLTADQVFSAEEKTKFKETLKEATKRTPNPMVEKMVEMQLGWIDSGNTAFLEMMEFSAFFPSTSGMEGAAGKSYFSLNCEVLYPLSRGTVHIVSADPNVKPEVDPHFFEHEVDVEVLLAAFKFVRNVLTKTKAFGDSVVGEVTPGKDIESDEALKKFIKDNFGVVYHPVGTAAMLPKELGGVVDKDLKVYGTANLRVADASIFPVEFSVHPMATVYAMAEKAADIISGAK